MAADDSGDLDGGAVYVTEDSLVVVHEGELILRGPGTKAQAKRVAADATATIEYVFPVEIEVRGGGEALDVDAIARRALDLLAARLEQES